MSDNKDQSSGGNDDRQSDPGIPEECVEGYPCRVINQKPECNFFLAYFDVGGNWTPVQDHCDEGCYPNPDQFTLIAEVGDCAYFECQCDEGRLR